MVVKHLVLSGGGPSLFGIFGALHELHNKQKWDINEIVSIYGCSSGALLAILLCLVRLGLTFNELEEYLIHRTWDVLVTSKVLGVHNAFTSKGLFDKSLLLKAIGPLFSTVSLDPNISLNELCSASNIQVYMYTVDVNTKPLTKIELSSSNYGHLPVYELLTMSMGLPGLITPSFLDDKCLIDGGLMVNFPMKECITRESPEHEEVLGFKIKWTNRDLRLKEDTNFLSFMAHLMKMMAFHIDYTESEVEHDYDIVFCSIPDVGGPSGWMNVFIDPTSRADFVRHGVQSATEFIFEHQERSSQTRQECHT
jgi:predicted acylesterase/phospholipase RssA